MATTVKPSGLTITRSNMKFTFAWKIADKDYGAGQELQYRTNLMKEGKWTAVEIGKTVTSKSISLSASDYAPTTTKKLTSVSFRVRGKRKAYTEGSGKDKVTYTPDWSGWTEKAKSLLVPLRPELTSELDNNNANSTKFTWSLDNDVSSARPFAHIEYQSIRVKDSTVTDGSSLKWKSSQEGWHTGTTSASGNHTYTEDTTILTKASYTRWVRVRARGAAGDSDWRYAKHVYAIPKKAEIKETKASVSGSTTTVTATWNASSNAANPIDSTIVQYAIGTPASGMSVPAGISWTDASSTKDTSGKDAAKFTIDTVLDLDQCLWTRIATKHDSNTTYSAAELVRVGKLTKPTDLNVQVNAETYRATVSATNNSAVPDSRLAVIYRDGDGEDTIVGIIPHGSTSITVQCPVWTSSEDIAFGVYAFQGDATYTTVSGVRKYAITANMTSGKSLSGGDVPTAPDNLTVNASETPGEVILRWQWSWRKANCAEISWSLNPNAWESTETPQTHEVGNLNAAQWRVSGLEMGRKWYFRVRLAKSGTGGLSYGPYSDTEEIDLSATPDTPVLTLSEEIITADGNVTASWNFSASDGTEQGGAIVCLATVTDNVVAYGDVIASATTEQSVVLAENWEAGETYYLCVKVTSSGDKESAWSEPVPLKIADPVACVITYTSLDTNHTTIIDGEEITETALTAMPLSVTAEGGDILTLIVERADEYHMIRPDETEADGYEGETIVIERQESPAQFVIGIDDLIGLLDDGAPYRLIVTAEDGYGQTAQADPIAFVVRWSHQADAPSGSEATDGLISIITPVAPEGFAEGDVCDIYRLSADRPELIIKNGDFGVQYVDPYPALGERRGHRIVHRTANGDYITETLQPAWADTRAELSERSIIIDFAGNQIILPYDITLANRWNKDFRLTSYLGGAQTGDWNPAVTRTATYSTVLLTDEDADMIDTMRKLSAYSDICHVRTPEGSSYSANIDVSENKAYSDGVKVSFSLTVTRVDPEGLDGMTLEEWRNEYE